MSEARPGAASAIGFRRDVTWFLSALVGFFVILILILVALMQVLVGQSERLMRAAQNRVADEAVRTINELPADAGAATIEGALVGIRARSGIVAVELRPPGENAIRVGEIGAGEGLERNTRHGPATLVFDTSETDALSRRLYWVTIISFASVIGGTILLLLYVRRISRPIERLLDEASAVEARPHGVEETQYLIDTFRSTIANLREKEVELRRLHDAEKARADELELVSGTLTRSLSSGFLALDAAGALVEMNEAGRRILDLPESPLGAGPHEAIGDNEFSRTIASACERRESLNRIEVALEREGSAKTIGLSTAPLFDAGGRFLGLLALYTDLTPVRDLETRVREMRVLADLGELAAGIAHEFRNSLSTIRGYLKLAARAGLPDEADARVRAADQEAAQLAEAVTGLLGFAGPMTVRPTRVPLRPLLEAVWERLEHQTTTVRLELACEDVEVSGDAALLSRAFENVARNAIEAVDRSGESGSVRIGCGRDGQLVRVDIEDDGVGIDPSEIPAAFLPFRSGRPGGFGLGLALARKIIVLHGGTIAMEPRRERGVRVRVELPCASAGA